MTDGAEWWQQQISEEHEQHEQESINEPNQPSPAGVLGDLPCDF
jgi:hypothetical protein